MFGGWLLGAASGTLTAQETQNLQQTLQRESLATLVERVETYGRAEQGALIFYQSAAACVQCHGEGEQASPLGPRLSELGAEITTARLVEAVLAPSKTIREGYETVRVLTTDGTLLTGLRQDAADGQVALRAAEDLDQRITLPAERVEAVSNSDVSMMPEGLVASLREPQQFYDLIRYVREVAQGGPARAKQLRPSPEQLALADDTSDLDHAGILAALGPEDLQAGRAIYFGHCVNCHGADGNTPKLATARAFGTQRLKFGADPRSMLVTLTRGNGLMGPMRHLSPKERYQVIYFIRQRFMKGSNPGFEAIDAAYLASLPKGSDSGEAKRGGERDFGPVLASQLGNDVNSGLSFRLPDQVTVNYDLHRFRLGGIWTGGFLDLSETQHYRQRGERMPQPVGTPLPSLASYAWELGGSFEIPQEAKPPRGPVREDWATYHGHYLHGDQAILCYAIHGRDVLETITSAPVAGKPVVRHTLRIAASEQPLRLRVLSQTGSGQPGIVDSVSGERVTASAAAAGHVPFVPSQLAKAREGAAHENEAWHVVAAAEAQSLDLGTPQRTLVVRFRTTQGGTLVASAPAEGDWKPNGKTLFIRGDRLVFDIGWVGAITGKTPVTDNQWHTAGLVVTDEETRLYLDGKLEARRASFRRPPAAGHVLKVGATAANFGGDFDGEIAWAAILDAAATPARLTELAGQQPPRDGGVLWQWTPSEPRPQVTPPSPAPQPPVAAASLAGDTEGLRWDLNDAGEVILTIPAADTAKVIELSRVALPEDELATFRRDAVLRNRRALVDPAALTHGGPERWPQRLQRTGSRGQAVNGYALDAFEVPFENPWNAWMRTSALDFFSDGRCVVTTHGGDVYLVSGLAGDLQQITWKRFAAGLFEPFGVRVVDGQIYVTCRDGIKRLHDFDGNDEVDFVEAFWIDDDVSSMFHAYNFDLQTDSAGNFYFAKAGQYTRHHRPGTIMKIPPEGGRAEVVAWGLRTPNGMGKLKGDRFTVSDNQGPWMPAGKISLIRKGGFFGNMPVNDAQDEWLRKRHGGGLPETFDEPFIWMPQELDNSCGGQLWVSDPRWGPLAGRLIHSSFGKGKLYHLSLQEIDGVMQSSIIRLPHQWDAGVMRLRVNPRDGQVYGTGLSGWQGPASGKDGCLQRLRYTGEPVRMIDRVEVVPGGVRFSCNFPLADEVSQADAWKVQMWDYKWSRNYGSDQYSVLQPGQKGRDDLTVAEVELAEDGRTATIRLPDLQACDQLWVELEGTDADGQPFQRSIYLTIHAVPPR